MSGGDDEKTKNHFRNYKIFLSIPEGGYFLPALSLR